MEEYKPNSHKSKEEKAAAPPEKRVEKVVTGLVKSKKKTESTRSPESCSPTTLTV